MATEQALALVVRGTDWSETSKITTLFTLEFGKVRALAKGGRRLKSNFDCAFDLLNVCRIVFIRKSSGGLDLLTEARMEEQFPILRENLRALYTAYYIAELLADGTQDYDPHPTLFHAALGTLRGLAKGVEPRDAATAFELVWLRELGYSPRLDACAVCGNVVLPRGADRVVFSPNSGGILCTSCGPNATDRYAITANGLGAIRELSAAIEIDTVVSPQLTAEVREELRPVLGMTVSYVLGRRPRLLSFVDGR